MVEAPPGERLLGGGGANGTVGDAEERDPRGATEHLAVDLDRDGGAGEREVALLARDLLEAEALPVRAPGMRTWVRTSSGRAPS